MTSAEHESSTTAPPHVLARLHDLLDDLPALAPLLPELSELDDAATSS